MHWNECLQNKRETDPVLANLIQPDASSSGTQNLQALPLQSCGQRTSSFASTLQSAERNGSPMSVQPQSEATKVMGRGKSAEKDSTKNSKPSVLGQTSAIGSTRIAGANPISLLAGNLETMPSLRSGIAVMPAIQGSTVLSAANSRSDNTSGVTADADSATRATPVGAAGEVHKDALPHNLATVSDSGLSVAASDAGKQTPVGGFASPPNVATAPGMQVIPLPAGEARPLLTAVDESGAGKPVLGSNALTRPSVASQELLGTLTSASAAGDAPAQILSPPVADFARFADNGDPAPATLTSSGMPLLAMDSKDNGMNAAAGVQQSTSGSKLQPGTGDIGSLSAIPAEAGMLAHAMNVTSGSGNAAGVQLPTTASMPQSVTGETLIPLPIATPIGKPLPAQDPTTSTARAVSGFGQPASDSKAQSGNRSGQESLAALAFPFTGSRAAFSAEILRPGGLHGAVAMRAPETVPAADTLATETHTVQVSSKQVSSDQFSPNQVPSHPVALNQAPPNQEGARSKPADSGSDPAGANAQPLSPSAAPITGQPSGTDQPGSPAATANVLAQVSPAGNQDSGSRSTPSAAPEPQPATTIPPTALPAVGPVETARLVGDIAQSEMHIGLRTQAFGSVEVHTVVRDSQLGLTLGSERGDLRTLLAPEVSGLQTTFRQQDLRFDNIHFLETNSGTTSGFSGGTDSQPRSPNQQHSSPAGVFSIHGPPEHAAEVDVSVGSRTRLNVHA